MYVFQIQDTFSVQTKWPFCTTTLIRPDRYEKEIVQPSNITNGQMLLNLLQGQL